jgi:hypothetical protein
MEATIRRSECLATGFMSSHEFSDFLWEGTRGKTAEWKKGVSLLFLSFYEVG